MDCRVRYQMDQMDQMVFDGSDGSRNKMDHMDQELPSFTKLLEEPRQRGDQEDAVLPDVDAHGYLQGVYRGTIKPEHWRMRAAIECLPFERPKLAVVASFDGDDFA